MTDGKALEVASVTDTSGSEWKTAKTGDDTFQGRMGFAWYQADLPDRAAPGRVLRFQQVDVLDARGRIVPTADDLATFAVNGVVADVGNGNPGDHDPDKASYRHTFNGKCLVIVGAKEKSGAITLGTTATGLKPATLELRSLAPTLTPSLR